MQSTTQQQRARPRILIEVSGGVVQNVVSDFPVDVLLRDEDNIEAGDPFDPTDLYPLDVTTPEDFTAQIHNAP
jgi:hypothetical protein